MIEVRAGLAADGNDQRAFSVHEGLLSFYAEPLGSRSEQDGQLVSPLEEDANTVHKFVFWLYTETLPRTNVDTIIDIWLFADRYAIPLLKNETIDALNQFIIDNESMPLHRLADIYANGNEHTQLRGMISHAMSWYLDADSISQVRQWPQAALADTIERIVLDGSANAFPDPDYKWQNMCPEFHVHDDGELCPVRWDKNQNGEMEWV